MHRWSARQTHEPFESELDETKQLRMAPVEVEYPTYGEVHEKGPAKKGESRQGVASFRFSQRREHSSTHGPPEHIRGHNGTPRKSAHKPDTSETLSRVQGELSPSAKTQLGSRKDRLRTRDRTTHLLKWSRDHSLSEFARHPFERSTDQVIHTSYSLSAQIDDWRTVHLLGDQINASGSQSKEAIRVLRQELRSSSVHARRRAIRAWCLWSLSSGGTFGTYAANTQLLSLLESMLEDPNCVAPLREDALEALSALAYRPIARLWIRVRPSGSSPVGQPLQHALFGSDPSPVEKTSSRNLSQISQDALPTDSYSNERNGAIRKIDSSLDTLPASLTVHRPISQSYPPTHLMTRQDQLLPALWTGKSDSGAQDLPSIGPELPEPSFVPDNLLSTSPEANHVSENAAIPGHTVSPQPQNPDETKQDRIQKIFYECREARSNASVLYEALTYEGVESPLAVEFLHEAQESQSVLLNELSWASAQTESPHLEQESLRAEALLADVLDALSVLGESLSLYTRLQPADANNNLLLQRDAQADPSDSDAVVPSQKALGKRRAFEKDNDLSAQVENLELSNLSSSDFARPPDDDFLN